MDRRDWVKAAMGLSVAAAAPAFGSAAAGAATKVVADVPLAVDRLRAALVQTRIGLPDPQNPQPVLRANLAHMLEWLDRAQSEQRHDLVMFHELPLTGLSFSWPRSTVHKLCIEVPGPEIEAIAAKARKYRCHVTFGAYIVDRDWPNHFMLAIVILGPDGSVVDVQWKARNIMGAFRNMELMTTTIFNVLERYVEMYGWDRVIPVARTSIGNIAASSVQLEPELYRAYGMKGAELVLRVATGRYRMVDVQGASLHNGYWSMMVNNAYLPDDPEGLRRYWPDGDWRKPTADSTTVLSTVVDAQGNIVAQATSPEEQIVSVEIPIAAHRAARRPVVMHKELYDRQWRDYTGPYPPGAFIARQPADVQEAATIINAGLRRPASDRR
jgi:predicted amidohydrolase